MTATQPLSSPVITNGDLNNVSSMRVATLETKIDKEYLNRSLAITEVEDEAEIREKYRPFLLSQDVSKSDWISKLELSTVLKMSDEHTRISEQARLKVLVLYGSMRNRYVLLPPTAPTKRKKISEHANIDESSYSRLLAYEASRILFRLGCDVRIYNPANLPVKDDIQHSHPKVQELRDMSRWSDGHIWVSPEQHGNLVSLLDLPHLLPCIQVLC